VPPEINSPEVDITGALSDLDSDLGEVPTIGADPCSVVQKAGRGALPGNSQRLSSVQEITINPQGRDTAADIIERKLPSDSRLAHKDVNETGGCRTNNI